jgi:hypothetical protein
MLVEALTTQLRAAAEQVEAVAETTKRQASHHPVCGPR